MSELEQIASEMQDDHEPIAINSPDGGESDIMHVDGTVPRSLKIAGAVGLAFVAAALCVAVVTPGKTKPPEAAAPIKQEAPKENKEVFFAKGVRVIPIYQKIQDRATMEPATLYDKTAKSWIMTQKTTEASPQASPPPSPPPPPVPVSEPVSKAVELEEPPSEPTIHRRLRKAEHHASGGDICEQHHMHKVFTHEGKSWRCRK